MSSDISYVIKVVDEFSANIKKFQGGINNVDQQTKKVTQTLNNAQSSSKFFTQNLIDMGKAAGLYFGAREILGFAKNVFDTRVQMDSLSASLAAIMPRFDKTKSGAQLAAEEIEYLKDVTQKFGISFKQALPSYMQFLASSKQDLATTRKTFEAFSGIARVYGLSSERFGLVITALNQMQSKGIVSMEELRQQLSESLPQGLQLFAEAAGMSTQQFMKLVGEGRIGAGLLKLVAENIEKKFGKDMVEASKTLGAQTERLGNNFLYVRDRLGKELLPVMSAGVSVFSDFANNTVEIINAVSNQNAFNKLTEDGKALVTMLRVATGLLKGFAEELKLIFDIGRVTFGGIKDFISGATILGYTAMGGDQEIAKGAFQELGQKGTNRFNEAFGDQELKNQIIEKKNTQTVDVNINLNNAPRGTTSEVKQPNNRATGNVGIITNYN